MAKFNIKFNPEQQPLIKIENFRKSYGKKVIFDNLNLDIGAGEKIALLGHNGSGKTTIVEIISNLRRASEGTITYKAKNINQMGTLISTQHQSLEYPEGYKVIEVLEFFAAVGTNNAEERKEELRQMIDIFDMSHIVPKRINALSGGEMQRVNLVLALMDKSQVLILDEIATGLDASIYDQALAFIEEYIEINNMTLILISHHHEEIRRFTDKVYVIKDRQLLPSVPTDRFSFGAFENAIDQNQSRESNVIEKKKDVDFENLKIGKKLREYRNKMFATKTEKLPKNKIIVKGVSKSFGMKSALEDISFEIFKGESLAILGGNGAGKTTFMEILAKVQKQSKGSIEYWWGKKNFEISAGIGMQFQSSLFPNDLKVWEVIEMFARSSEKSLTWFEIIKLAEKFNLGEIWKQGANSISGGQRQKLNVLIALLKKPEIVILDEISTGLDVISQREIIKLVKSYIEKNNLTLIIISHNPKEIKELADNAIIFTDGKTNGKRVSISKISEKEIKEILVSNSEAREWKASDIKQLNENSSLEVIKNAKTYATKKVKDTAKIVSDKTVKTVTTKKIKDTVKTTTDKSVRTITAKKAKATDKPVKKAVTKNSTTTVKKTTDKPVKTVVDKKVKTVAKTTTDKPVKTIATKKAKATDKPVKKVATKKSTTTVKKTTDKPVKTVVDKKVKTVAKTTTDKPVKTIATKKAKATDKPVKKVATKKSTTTVKKTTDKPVKTVVDKKVKTVAKTTTDKPVKTIATKKAKDTAKATDKPVKKAVTKKSTTTVKKTADKPVKKVETKKTKTTAKTTADKTRKNVGKKIGK